MAYATGSQLVTYHDVRQLGELIADDDTRVLAAAVPTNAKVTAALSRASGDINRAALKGKRYTVADLTSLTGDNLEALAGLCCDIAFWHLAKRRLRGAKVDDIPGAKESFEVLNDLALGHVIFPTDDAIDAVGMEATPVGSANSLGLPTSSARYGTTVNVARRYFGRRGAMYYG